MEHNPNKPHKYELHPDDELDTKCYHQDIFLDQSIKSYFTCPLGYGILNHPVIDICGHTFCHYCITQWININAICPISKKGYYDINKEALIPNYIVRKFLDSQKVKCYKECGWEDRFELLNEHINQYCDLVLVKCIHYEKCKTYVLRKDLGEHLKTCKMICKDCNQPISISEYKKHLEVCDKGLEMCKLGCFALIKREDLPTHYGENLSDLILNLKPRIDPKNLEFNMKDSYECTLLECISRIPILVNTLLQERRNHSKFWIGSKLICLFILKYYDLPQTSILNEKSAFLHLINSNMEQDNFFLQIKELIENLNISSEQSESLVQDQRLNLFKFDFEFINFVHIIDFYFIFQNIKHRTLKYSIKIFSIEHTLYELRLILSHNENIDPNHIIFFTINGNNINILHDLKGYKTIDIKNKPWNQNLYAIELPNDCIGINPEEIYYLPFKAILTNTDGKEEYSCTKMLIIPIKYTFKKIYHRIFEYYKWMIICSCNVNSSLKDEILNSDIVSLFEKLYIGKEKKPFEIKFIPSSNHCSNQFLFGDYILPYSNMTLDDNEIYLNLMDKAMNGELQLVVNFNESEILSKPNFIKRMIFCENSSFNSRCNTEHIYKVRIEDYFHEYINKIDMMKNLGDTIIINLWAKGKCIDHGPKHKVKYTHELDYLEYLDFSYYADESFNNSCNNGIDGPRIHNQEKNDFDKLIFYHPELYGKELVRNFRKEKPIEIEEIKTENKKEKQIQKPKIKLITINNIEKEKLQEGQNQMIESKEEFNLNQPNENSNLASTSENLQTLEDPNLQQQQVVVEIINESQKEEEMDKINDKNSMEIHEESKIMNIMEEEKPNQNYQALDESYNPKFKVIRIGYNDDNCHNLSQKNTMRYKLFAFNYAQTEGNYVTYKYHLEDQKWYINNGVNCREVNNTDKRFDNPYHFTLFYRKDYS